MKNNMIYLQNLLKANPEEAEKYLKAVRETGLFTNQIQTTA